MKTHETTTNSCKQSEKNTKTDLIRQPRQTRSIETKKNILKTALKLFCENGFYKTTTNEIAKQASVPIGSLYSYFKNKDMILLEILADYDQSFLDKIDKAIQGNMNFSKNDKKLWIKIIIETLIELHNESKEFILELQALNHSMPEVAKIHDIHDLKIKEKIIESLEYFKDEVKITDLEASAVIISDIISSVVDRIVFNNNEISHNRIINEGVNVIYKYLFC
ncbi:TetR/AcrR family transcriptional regulator [Clostridium saccharobutylicum]|nr:TetR/AcrR family transcriptional regulator [Clostridium saccharobutylicum]AQR90167.1 fatty acid metabolism regulator protein [Clostridium saccharobutylicum]AQS00073.1 fatty acid metabolism regulator protein [Clostridium saccharobutylicum]AQS14056.1 fatty acid metabolism regulator protein [Clostridium saccharobutylicum]MBA2905515.1 AcrR family transcriptional regulator [Clostridium saccharobutylicum]MBA8789934.1 AcrR family transcriptional regulator [Clostridium saccharobutylicum]